MPFPCKDLVVTATPHAGEPDVYVSKTPYPTSDRLTYAAFENGDYTVTVSHWDPESSPGYYFIGVYGDCQASSVAANYTLMVSAVVNDDGDLLKNPKLGLNQVVPANGYQDFKFCIPYSCATVQVFETNCMDNTVCPGAYSYPELLVSRTKKQPRIHDLSYKMGQIDYRWVTVGPKDPAGRDNHGYFSGSWYASVYGWCTPDVNCCANPPCNKDDFATCAPCSYASNSVFNVTLNITKSEYLFCFFILKIHSF